jgi:hypothetical protein
MLIENILEHESRPKIVKESLVSFNGTNVFQKSNLSFEQTVIINGNTE